MTQTVRVPLSGNALYVSGTVNGVDKVWTREEGNWWSTTADRADDGVYHVALSIIYGDGKTTSNSITLYYGLVLITDRTQADVDRAAYLSKLWVAGIWTGTQDELNEWNSDLKGTYNASDLNRVGSAMAYLRDRFVDNGYDVDIHPKVAWTTQDIPTQSDMELYLFCVGTLRDVISVWPDTPETPDTMEGLDYMGANNIEKILEIVDQMLTNSIADVFYSGEIYSGEANS